MSDFVAMREAVAAQFKAMASTGRLFTVQADRGEIKDTYLNAFPAGANPVYRENTEHDCSCCKSFIRQAGSVVTINDNYQLCSIWDVVGLPEPYQTVVGEMSEYVRSQTVKNGFLSDVTQIGASHNYDNRDPSIKWEHFHVSVPEQFVSGSHSIGTKLSKVSNARQVFQRAMEEIEDEAIEIVLDLISQGTLYRGDQYERQVKQLKQHKSKYLSLPTELRANYSWKHCSDDNAVSHIRNSSIGTLLVDLSEGMELERAVKRYEQVTAPANYKRPTALVTPRMIEEAKSTVEELGLTDSLSRRFATYTDLSANDMVFVDRSAPVSDNPFDELSKTAAKRPPQNLSSIGEISIDDFVEQVLPSITGIELLVENRHQSNLMSLVAPVNADSKPLFQWSNNFSWAYNGDVTDSIKERVKAAGGNVEGFMRASLSWFNTDDLDIHCQEPLGGSVIYYGDKRSHKTGGKLDVDMNAGGAQSKEPVENITWGDPNKLIDGDYKIFVHQFSKRNSIDIGFEVEIEIDGTLHSLAYDKPVGENHKILVATITVKGRDIKVTPHIASTTASKEVWGIHTQAFQPVSLMLPSPNYWNGKANGQKHWMFILKDCKNPEQPRGFFNEYLRPDLAEHRKVFEVLGNKMRVEPSDDQLSGLGFSTTVRNSVTCRVSGSFNRTLKINF